MVWVGIGDVIGALFMGLIIDRFSSKMASYNNIIVVIIVTIVSIISV